MGKIFSKPKMPSIPVLPPLTTTSTTAPTNIGTTADGDPPVGNGGTGSDTTEPTPDEQRVTNILSRNRGRVGTIATSFNGVLSNDISNLPVRKTLLGE